MAKSKAAQEEIGELYFYLKSKLFMDEALNKWFQNSESLVDQVLAIDAFAHEIHAHRPALYTQLSFQWPSGVLDPRDTLDKLAGSEIKKDWRRSSRDYFASQSELSIFNLDIIKAEDEIKLTKEFTVPFAAVRKEAESLYSLYKSHSDHVTPGMILALSRLGYDVEKTGEEPLVVGGMASVEMVDREGHLITKKALRKGFRKFMDNPLTRNIQLSHGDVQAGYCLSFFVDKSGLVYKSGVYDKGLFICAEIRDDAEIMGKIRKEIEDGNIRSFSIAGSAGEKILKSRGGNIFYEINEIELMEISLCEIPVNPDAHFTLMKSMGNNSEFEQAINYFKNKVVYNNASNYVDVL